VSVWLGGNEIPVYAEPLGVYPDGTARSLYLQASQSLTNGAPVAGEVRLTGGFTQARRAFTDNTATFENNGTGTAWNVLGLPEGAIVPTSAAHICNCMIDGPLVPQATQPVFTGSVATDGALLSTLTTTLRARTAFPTGGATYDTGMASMHLWARTANSEYLRLALSWMSKERVAYWMTLSPPLAVPEWRIIAYSAAHWYLLTRDTVLADPWMLYKTEAVGPIGTLIAFMPRSSSVPWNSAPNNFPRPHAMILMFLTTVIATNPLGGARPGIGSPILPYTTHADAWLGRFNEAPQWNGDCWNGPAFSDAAFTIPIRTTLPFMTALMCDAIINLCRVIPSSPNTVAALNNVSTALLWLRTNYLVTSSGGTTTFPFATEAYFTPGANGGTDPAVDLNGFFPHLYAWRALRENSVADANLARTLYASLGLTPRDGQTGPFIGSQKQWDEAFHRSQTTLAYLQQSGL
jgi:hypothetical protein